VRRPNNGLGAKDTLLPAMIGSPLTHGFRNMGTFAAHSQEPRIQAITAGYTIPCVEALRENFELVFFPSFLKTETPS
jgi:hypothetical protein